MSKRQVGRDEAANDWLLFADADFDDDDDDAFQHAMERRSARHSERARRSARHRWDAMADRKRLRRELEDWDDYQD